MSSGKLRSMRGFPFFSWRLIVRIPCSSFRLIPAVVLPAVVFASSILRAADSPYAAGTGPGARHQAALDIANPAVVMSVCAEPGGEDFPTLAALRMGSGARVASVYVTDGGATPDEVDGDLPLRVAARRKFESESAVKSFGGEAYFLGFPDYGFVSTKGSLERIWNRDSLLNKLVTAIRTFRPDVILVGADPREREGDTVRSALIREVLAAAVRRSASGGGPAPGAAPWHVSRVFRETLRPGSPVAADVEKVHPVFRKSYRAIGAESALSYRSLRARIREWNAGRRGTYTPIEGESAKGLTGGLPVIPGDLRDAFTEVRQAASDAESGAGESALGPVSRAIARVESVIGSGGKNLGSLEKRILITWKERLEDLRCAILGVDVRFVPGDTLITRRQQFSLRFPPDRRFPLKGRSEIIFTSAIDSTWFINRSEGFRLSFTVPDTFEIVTPEKMRFDRPVSTNGSDSPSLYTHIPFVIVHRDPDPLRNFALRREIEVGVAPVQSVEVLTPFVRVTPGEQLRVRLVNTARDPYRGVMRVGDSVAQETHLPVTLLRYARETRYTLPLAWRDGATDGDHAISLRIGKGAPVGSFTARKFRAVVDTSRLVGVVTALSGGPLEDALRRLHVPYRLLDGSFSAAAAGGIGRILVDRDALVLREDGGRMSAAVAAWVRAGGHCVMLSQALQTSAESPLTEPAPFSALHLLAPEAGIVTAGGDSLLSLPNLISPGDWRDWIVARAEASVHVPADRNPVVHCRDESTGSPLIASVSMGEGTLTAVALDLIPQLQIVHPGAYRLLANLLSY